jgi:adenine phosphoribosyltransferase
MNLKDLIRDIPDFPEPGISFKDISPLLAHPAAWQTAIEQMTETFRTAGITKVAALDARGFLFAPPVANELKAGIVMLRKPGKLPGQTHSHEYTLEYGANTLEIQADALTAADKVLIVDDVIATGGSMAAAIQLVTKTGATVSGVTTLIGLQYLGDFESKLKKLTPTAKIHTVVNYD